MKKSLLPAGGKVVDLDTSNLKEVFKEWLENPKLQTKKSLDLSFNKNF